MDPFVAEIRIFPFNFAPKGWALCNGQLLAISQNTALFSLLGTNYGGDGRTTFGLPDLQGSVPVHVGGSTGPGLSSYVLGESGGSDTITLLQGEMPMHNHALQALGTAANSSSASNTLLASPNYTSGTTRGVMQAYTASAPDTAMSALSLSPTGGSLPHNNLMPYLTLNYCIALQGVYPPRS